MGQSGGRVGGWRGERGWSCPGLGMGGVRKGRWFGGVVVDGWGALVRKTSNLSPCPVPLVVKLNARCRGQCGDKRLSSRIWFGVDRWIRRHTARGAQTRPRTELQIHPTTFLVTTCGIVTTAGQQAADPE